jgi:PHD/YefM family antitoxin component YafN of YafNO toxin-antitoxin module
VGKIRIKSHKELQQRLDKVLDSLHEGPVFVATDKRVRAVLMDMSDYYDLMDEISDLAELLHELGGCGCGCDCEEEEEGIGKILEKAFSESGD